MTIPAGGSAALSVVGTEILLDGTACPGSITTVDRIHVNAPARQRGDAHGRPANRSLPARPDGRERRRRGRRVGQLVHLGDRARRRARPRRGRHDPHLRHRRRRHRSTSACAAPPSAPATRSRTSRSVPLELYGLPPLTYELHGLGGRNTLSARGAAPTGGGRCQRDRPPLRRRPRRHAARQRSGRRDLRRRGRRHARGPAGRRHGRRRWRRRSAHRRRPATTR